MHLKISVHFNRQYCTDSDRARQGLKIPAIASIVTITAVECRGACKKPSLPQRKYKYIEPPKLYFKSCFL